jgi:parallel beta-helix repeat protein
VTALNTYLSAHAGQTIILYWPQGKYLFSGAIDMSGIPAWEFRGDGYDAAGGNGSRIAFTGTPGTNCIIADYGPTGCGQFHIRYMSIGTNQATGSTYVGIYMRNCAMSSIFNSQIQGNTCISMVNCFKCVMASVELAATLDGINMQNCYGCTLENPDVDGIPVGDAYHIGGGNKNALFSARAEVCDVALRIGTDADGNPSTTNNLSVCAASFEANNSGIIGANSINDYMSGIGIHCTTGSPAGHSRVAYVRQNTTDFTMLSCFNDGACSNVDGGFADGWAWYYASQTDRGLMVDCNGSNTSPNKNGTFDNLSSGTITQVACSFP